MARVSIGAKGRLSIAGSSRACKIGVFPAVCRFLGSPHVYGAGTYAKAKRKEDSVELKTNRETTHALDSLLRQAINNNGEALDELFARFRDRAPQNGAKRAGKFR